MFPEASDLLERIEVRRTEPTPEASVRLDVIRGQKDPVCDRCDESAPRTVLLDLPEGRYHLCMACCFEVEEWIRADEPELRTDGGTDDLEVGLFMWNDDHGHRAWGAAFPNGDVAMIWDTESWPVEEQLHHDHMSLYGDVGDVLHANGGRLTWGGWDD